MKRNIFYTSVAQVGIQGLGLLTGIMAARWLGPAGRGQLAAVISWAAMLSYIGNLGLPVAYTYASAREPWRRHQLFGNGIIATGAQWLVLAFIGWWVLPMALASQGPSIMDMARMYLLVYLPLNLLTLYLNAIQQGAAHYAGFNAVRLSVPLGYALLLVLLWGAHHFTVESVVVANLLSNMLTLTLAVSLMLSILLKQQRESQTTWIDFKKLIGDARYGLSAHLGTLQPFSGLRIDVLTLSVLVAAHELGLYMAALAAASVLRAQGFALGQVALPEVAKRIDRTEQIRVIRRLSTLAVAGGTAAWIVVLLWAEPLLRQIYGTPFVPAAPMLKILVLAGALAAVYRVLADGLRGMGRPLVSTWAELASLVVGLIALVVMVPNLGAYGAALAVTLASVVSLLVLVWLAFKTPVAGQPTHKRDGMTMSSPCGKPAVSPEGHP